MFDTKAQSVMSLRNELLDHVHDNYADSVDVFDLVVAFSSIAAQIAHDAAPTKRHAKGLIKTGLQFGRLILEDQRAQEADEECVYQ